MSDSLFLAFDGQAPQWQTLPDWEALFPLPQGLTVVHVIAWLTPQRLDPLLEVLDRLGVDSQLQVRVHLVLGEGFETAEVACEYVHDVEAILLAGEQPQITSLIGQNRLQEHPQALGAMVLQATGARQFLSLQAIRFAAEENLPPEQVVPSVLDLAYEGAEANEPIIVWLPAGQPMTPEQFFAAPSP